MEPPTAIDATAVIDVALMAGKLQAAITVLFYALRDFLRQQKVPPPDKAADFPALLAHMQAEWPNLRSSVHPGLLKTARRVLIYRNIVAHQSGMTPAPCQHALSTFVSLAWCINADPDLLQWLEAAATDAASRKKRSSVPVPTGSPSSASSMDVEPSTHTATATSSPGSQSSPDKKLMEEKTPLPPSPPPRPPVIILQHPRVGPQPLEGASSLSSSSLSPSAAALTAVTAPRKREQTQWMSDGHRAFHRGAFKAASSIFTRVINSGAHDARVFCMRALCHERLEAFSVAITDARTALSLLPTRRAAVNNKVMAECVQVINRSLAALRPSTATVQAKQQEDHQQQQLQSSTGSSLPGDNYHGLQDIVEVVLTDELRVLRASQDEPRPWLSCRLFDRNLHSPWTSTHRTMLEIRATNGSLTAKRALTTWFLWRHTELALQLGDTRSACCSLRWAITVWPSLDGLSPVLVDQIMMVANAHMDADPRDVNACIVAATASLFLNGESRSDLVAACIELNALGADSADKAMDLADLHFKFAVLCLRAKRYEKATGAMKRSLKMKHLPYRIFYRALCLSLFKHPPLEELERVPHTYCARNPPDEVHTVIAYQMLVRLAATTSAAKTGNHDHDQDRTRRPRLWLTLANAAQEAVLPGAAVFDTEVPATLDENKELGVVACPHCRSNMPSNVLIEHQVGTSDGKVCNGRKRVNKLEGLNLSALRPSSTQGMELK